jgi:precorrin-2 dehydrogenase / sirohydrochlorin ferrochelatase
MVQKGDALMSKTAALFPMFLRLEGRDALVVGAGHVAQPKIQSLLLSGARVRVVAPQATRPVQAWARAGRVHWQPREFRAADLEGASLVIAATSSPRLHERILRLARRRGVLCNVVDDPERCDFFYPAVVRRGRLQIAVSTGGASPALAQRLRKELERQFGPEYEAWVEQLRGARADLRARGLGPRARARLSHRLARPHEFKAFVRAAHKSARRATAS